MSQVKVTADSGGGTVSLKAPASTTGNADFQLTLPVDDGTANQHLKTDGSGGLSWTDGGTPGISSSSTGDVITIDANHHVMFRDISSNVDTRNVSGITIKSPHGITIRGFGANGSRNWRIRPDDLGGWADLDFSCAPTDGATDIPDAAADNVLSLQGDTKDVVVANGNLVIGTSGKGIDFSTTSDAGGMTSELLDDYEEGTWTPTVSAGTVTVYASKYVKIGTLVHIHCHLTNFSDTSNTNNLNIDLPFSAISAAGSFGNSTLGSVVGNYVDNPGGSCVAPYVGNNGTFMACYLLNTGNWDAITNQDIQSSSSSLIIGLTYWTA